jgi:cyclopropane-fatty-acyl-phospholipid synthase
MTVSTTMRWPSIARTPRAPLHASVARAIFERAVRMVPVQVSTPDGILNPESPRPGAPEFRIVRPSAFFARLGRDTKVGFGESYMAGDWRAGEGTDLADLLTPFAARLTTLVPQPLQRLRAVVDKRIPQHHQNTLEGSRDNIAAHYDLSNDLFQAFLDPTLSYSSAWFDDDADLTTARDLEGAQLRKIDGILDYAAVRSGTRVLEIGTGWGGFAL